MNKFYFKKAGEIIQWVCAGLARKIAKAKIRFMVVFVLSFFQYFFLYLEAKLFYQVFLYGQKSEGGPAAVEE